MRKFSSLSIFLIAASLVSCGQNSRPNILLIITDQHSGTIMEQPGYKYILFDGGENPEQFFDLEKDPGELHPVTNLPEYQKELEAHRQMLKDWVTKTTDPFFTDSPSTKKRKAIAE